ncbi:MAG: TVP38/TMEM64 family protein [Promethearchaeota archaeon]
MGLKEILKDRKTYYILIFLAIVAITALLLVLWVFDNEIFARWAVKYLIIPVIQLGSWGIVLFLAVMIIQGLLLPIPSEIVLLTTGLLWGILGGAVMGVIGSMLAGWVCYFIVLKGGRPIAEKFVSKKILDPIDNLIEKYGFGFIVVARAVPLMAFDPISYASGLLKVDVKKYTVATLAGSIIRGIFFAWLGSTLLPANAVTWSDAEWITFVNSGAFDSFANSFNVVLLIIMAVLIGFFLIYYFVLNPYLMRKGDQLKDSGESTGKKESDQDGRGEGDAGEGGKGTGEESNVRT